MNIIEWRDALLDSSLNYKAKFIGLVLSQFYRRGNSTYPSIRTLSKLSGLTVNPVQDGIQILIDAKFISRTKERISGDRYLSNIYSFCGVIENGHVSPNDTSPRDTSGGDTSNDTSNDTSPRDTKVEEKKDKVEREALPQNFKDLIFEGEFLKVALECGLTKEIGASTFLIWKRKRKEAPPPDLLGDFWIWCLREKKPENNVEKPLEGRDKEINDIGRLNWRRRASKNNSSFNLTPLENNKLNEYEKLNGKVWWDNLRQYREGKK